MINHIAIIGNGMIGAAWSAMFTGNGIRVKVIDMPQFLNTDRYDNYYKDLMELGMVTEKQFSAAKKLLALTADYADLADEEVIFECVPEKLDIKFSVYEKVEANCPNLKAIASSTSATSPADLAKGMKAKEKLIGAHPWNPPHLVPCVEVVKNDYTDQDSMDMIVELLEYCGREGSVMNKPAPGFIANRLQHALVREAVNIVEEGICSPRDVDKALRSSFAPRYTAIGLFEHQDYAGLDMVKNIHDYVFPTLSNADRTQAFIEERYDRGDLGVKTGKGIYDWSEVDMDAFRKKASEPYLQFFNWKLPEE